MQKTSWIRLKRKLHCRQRSRLAHIEVHQQFWCLWNLHFVGTAFSLFPTLLNRENSLLFTTFFFTYQFWWFTEIKITIKFMQLMELHPRLHRNPHQIREVALPNFVMFRAEKKVVTYKIDKKTSHENKPNFISIFQNSLVK